MSSTANQPDLTLPPTVPTWDERYEDLLPAALYTLVDLSPEAFTSLQTACESEYAQYDKEFVPGSNVAPAPRSHFVGEPLRAVVDYHVRMNQELGSKVKLHPMLFIVAFHQDWKKYGVLMVTLTQLDDDGQVRYSPDAIKMETEHSGIVFTGLQIATTGWEEVKCNYDIGDNDVPREDSDTRCQL